MNNFETTDFVQVEHVRLLESGEPSTFWRNALYVGKQGNEDGNHIVLYTDGTKEVLHRQMKIRQAA